MNTKPELCHCGQPLHYTDPAIETIMRKMVETFGNNVIVTARGRSWYVPRHYIALHGLNEADLPKAVILVVGYFRFHGAFTPLLTWRGFC